MVQPSKKGALATWNPFDLFRQDFGDFWDKFASGDPWSASKALAPALDLSESEKAVTVKVDLPGIKQDDIDLQITGRNLTIRGERKEEREEKEANYHHVERRVGYFSRTVELPCEVNHDGVEAQHGGGVLTVVLPKAGASTTRKIKVKG